MINNYSSLLSAFVRKLFLACAVLVSFQAVAQFQGALSQAGQDTPGVQDIQSMQAPQSGQGTQALPSTMLQSLSFPSG